MSVHELTMENTGKRGVHTVRLVLTEQEVPF